MSFEAELLHHKKLAELQYVVALYSDVELFDEYKMKAENLSNSHWRLYYVILENMIAKKRISKVDEMNMDIFISEQKEGLQKLYENAGGFATIAEAKQIIETENVESYHREVLRYTALHRMYKAGFSVERDWSELSRLSYEQLADVVEGKLNAVFADIDMGDEKVQDIKDGVWDMVIEADKGINRGLPVHSKALNSVINGQTLGNITMVAAASGVGKTYTTLCQTMPSFIEEEEPVLIACNEEDLKKWQKELLTWIANNVIKEEFVKSRFYQGAFTSDEWLVLKKAKEWMDEKVKDGLIKFISFNTFSMNKTIKLIRKHSAQDNIKYFIIDTLKLDNDMGSSVTDSSWLQLQQNMVKLYNVIKPTAKNVHVWVTYQLNKSVKTRHLDQSALGMSKNVADVVSTLILIRDVLETEKGSEAKALQVKGVGGGQKILNEDRDYMVAFIDKNRQGSTNTQIVWRVNKDKNIMRDVGFTRIAQDY